jgi:hypothetical protein
VKEQALLTLKANFLVINAAHNTSSNASKTLHLRIISDGSLGAHFVARTSKDILGRLILEAILASCHLTSASLTWALAGETDTVH